MPSWSSILPTFHSDSDASSSITASALQTVRTAVAVPENELKRWRRTFDNNAKVINGERWVWFCRAQATWKLRGDRWLWVNIPQIPDLVIFRRFLDPDSFVNAIAPKGDLSKIGRAQFAILFRIADTSRRGLVSWDDFTVFETLLKRPDADYWMAFQYFDVWENFSCVVVKCEFIVIIPIATTRVLLTLMNSRVSFLPILVLKPYHSILTG